MHYYNRPLRPKTILRAFTQTETDYKANVKDLSNDTTVDSLSRYHIDSQFSWLEEIDSSRYYWISVNGNEHLQLVIPGLFMSSISALKEVIDCALTERMLKV